MCPPTNTQPRAAPTSPTVLSWWQDTKPPSQAHGLSQRSLVVPAPQVAPTEATCPGGGQAQARITCGPAGIRLPQGSPPARGPLAGGPCPRVGLGASPPAGPLWTEGRAVLTQTWAGERLAHGQGRRPGRGPLRQAGADTCAGVVAGNPESRASRAGSVRSKPATRGQGAGSSGHVTSAPWGHASGAWTHVCTAALHTCALCAPAHLCPPALP